MRSLMFLLAAAADREVAAAQREQKSGSDANEACSISEGT